MPETLEALEKYLASGNVKWIGPKTAKKIIKQFFSFQSPHYKTKIPTVSYIIS